MVTTITDVPVAAAIATFRCWIRKSVVTVGIGPVLDALRRPTGCRHKMRIFHSESAADPQLPIYAAEISHSNLRIGAGRTEYL